mmetsp:Transcript_10695/g.30688  ORF Transcript_10695/g.30688 Transcript_10695/m.30688 type:complete len:325 (-) Transcript_10695:192-1166(-)
MDQDRLHWPESAIAPNIKLSSLDLESVEIVRKEYKDKPKLAVRGRGLSSASIGNAGMLGGVGGGQAAAGVGLGGLAANGRDSAAGPGRLDLSIDGYSQAAAMAPMSEIHGSAASKDPKKEYQLMYTRQTGEMYEEWNIVKTNRWGRNQKRVIGIGRDISDTQLKIFNSKRDDVNKSRLKDNVFRSARLVKSLISAERVKDKPRFFLLTFRDREDGPDGRGNRVTVQYEVPYHPVLQVAEEPRGEKGSATSVEEAENMCLRIICKILFVQDLQRKEEQRSRQLAGGALGDGSDKARTSTVTSVPEEMSSGTFFRLPKAGGLVPRP